jgi:hypothetical protein
MIGFFIGGICGVGLMCLLQIYRDNEAQRRINRAIEYIGNKNIGIPRKTRDKAIKILGGDVDDE